MIKTLKDLKINIDYDLKAINQYEKEIKTDLKLMNSEGFNNQGIYIKTFIDTKKEMIKKRKSTINFNQNKVIELKNQISLMLKYFKKDLSPKTKGMVLKLLNKVYDNRFKDNGLKGYSVKLWELINFSIENNMDFYLQFKTLENNCLKIFDDELKRWL